MPFPQALRAAATDTLSGRRIRAIGYFVMTCVFALAPLAAPNFRGYDPAAFPVPIAVPPIQPAPFAFAIWLVIYAGLIAGAGYGLVRRAQSLRWNGIRVPMMLSLALGAAWLETAARAPVLATAILWGMSASALWALARLPARGHVLLRLPIGLYAGWVLAAAFVATGVTVMGHVGAPVAVSLAGIGLLAAVALLATWRFCPPATFGVAVGWALFGILCANLGAGMLLPAACAVALAAVVVASLHISESCTARR